MQPSQTVVVKWYKKSMRDSIPMQRMTGEALCKSINDLKFFNSLSVFASVLVRVTEKRGGREREFETISAVMS